MIIFFGIILIMALFFWLDCEPRQISPEIEELTQKYKNREIEELKYRQEALERRFYKQNEESYRKKTIERDRVF